MSGISAYQELVVGPVSDQDTRLPSTIAYSPSLPIQERLISNHRYTPATNVESSEHPQWLAEPDISFAPVNWDSTCNAFSLGIDWDGMFPTGLDLQPSGGNGSLTGFSSATYT